jgi:4-amino-4-deoxy-L-arabinose transferase-like glycosyltransferase
VLRAAALGLALLGLVPVANLLTGGREVPWWRLGVLIWVGYGGLLLAALWVIATRWGDLADRILARAGAAVLRVPANLFAAAIFVVTSAFAIAIVHYCYAGRGFTGDEMAMTWHARMLAAGHLAIPAPAHPEFFNTVSVLEREGRWFSQYPIGGPALLAAGMLVGAVWLVHPLLLGVAAWQFYRFARRAFGELTARAAAMLFALTPFVLVLGATQMNHTPALAFTLLALAELAAWDDERPRRRALHAAGIGLAVGAIALVRPLDAALVALPIGVFQLARVRHDRRRTASLVVQCLAGAVPVALLLWANARTTGSPLLFGYDAAHGPAHALGFHLDPNGEMHSPRRGLVFASGYLMRFNRFLFEWPLPALLVVCAVLWRLRRATRWDALLLGLLASFLAGYAAYWHNGFFDGPRFLFPVAPVLVLYAARAPEAAAQIAHESWRRVFRLVVPACVACSWLIPLAFSSVPGRLVAQRGQRTKLKTDVVAQASAARLSNALVLVREPWRGRLLARLRGLGVPQFDAERVVNEVDACALQIALDESDSVAAGSPGERLVRVLARARSAGAASVQPGIIAESRVARAAGGPDSPRCREEAAADALGTMPYAMFLREQQISRDGRLTGDVVWARTLGPRDSLLRGAFGQRRWYVYKPGRWLDDGAEFVPLER